MKRWQKAMLFVAGLILAAGYWLLYDNRSANAAQNIDLAALRKAANALPGPKADGVYVETISRRKLPETLMVAGGGWGQHEIAVQSFRIGTGVTSILIDTGFSKAAADAMGVDVYDQAAQGRVLASLKVATASVYTHEHMDHIGGVLAAPNWQMLMPKARITREQFDHPENTDPVHWPQGSREGFKPLDYTGLYTLAPGIVLMKAPSHTPGSQLVFVQLANGREYLFTGDISSMDRNWRETRARSRLIGDMLVNEDRAAVFAWLLGFKALAAANPAVILVPSHDPAATDRLISEGKIKRGF